ncbi:ubiquitin carboxyl-terminal hydrolase 4-like [Ruditapes philippinarum]|uniref:ubiquitin carboxyl-terminal hydrolase 4-like n=1 Tax=Ruditapes philippinarum TaxID=129788 RepID=UPI00295A744C|nr:ubiquitin carboxyl-terminal hydrolase 4-like [Ruditapes philippinarum]
MAFLLDGLHEDLNRIKKKPYVELKDADNRPDDVVAKEAWDSYKLRNDSIITDIFHGLLKYTVICPECDKISVTFDPFCYLSLSVPVKKERQLEVFWVPLDPAKKPMQFKLTVPKMGCVADICDVLSQYVAVDKNFMVVTDVYNHRFHKVFAMSEAISQIMDKDDIFIYQVPVNSHDDHDLVVLPIYMRQERGKATYSQSYIGTYQLFGQPLLLPVPRQKCTYKQLYELVLQRISRFVTVPADNEKWWVMETQDEDVEIVSTTQEEEESNATNMNGQGDSVVCNGVRDTGDDSGMEVSNGDSTNSENSSDNENNKFSDINGQTDSDKEIEKPRKLFKFSVVNSYGTAEMDNKFKDDDNPLKLSSHMYISVDWSNLAKEHFYCDSEAESFEMHDTMESKPQKKVVIQLNDCLELFTSKEKLGENDPWNFPKCEKHQQATKKIDLWSLPDTLIIHLKRFSYNRYWRDKIDALVEFPAKGIDLGKFVISPADKSEYVYDLIGVSNHYGGLGGGHYTAYCKNAVENAWYYFDDSSVSESSEEATVSKAAYVLVYQKRGTWKNIKNTTAASSTTTSEDIEINGLDSEKGDGEANKMEVN